MNMTAKTKPRVTIEATVIRANGKVEHLGIISDNKGKIFSKIKKFFKGGS